MRIKGKILVLEVRMPTSIVNWLLLLKAEKKKERETKLNNKINKKPRMPCCWLDSTSSIPIDFVSYSGGDLGKH